MESEVIGFEPPTLLLDRLVDQYGIDEPEARRKFQETKKFLLLCVSHPEATFAPSTEIDACWHEFLLFSRSYADFCELAGAFVHHEPSTQKDPTAYARTLTGMKKKYGDLDPEIWYESADGSDKCCSTCGSSAH